MTITCICKTIFRSCHRSNQNILICVPLHARKSPFPIIPSPVNKTHSLPQLRFCNFFRPLSYPPSQYNSTSPGCNPSLLPTTALTFLDLTQSFPSLSPVHHPNITQCFPSASVPAFNPSSTFSPLANFCPPNVLPLFQLLFRPCPITALSVADYFYFRRSLHARTENPSSIFPSFNHLYL